MAVFRVERTHNYTVMSNYHLRNKGLSLKAKGLLSQMLEAVPPDNAVQRAAHHRELLRRTGEP